MSMVCVYGYGCMDVCGVSMCVCVICVYGISICMGSWGVWYEYVCGVSLYDHVI